MKRLICVLSLLAALNVPFVVYAQSTAQPKTDKLSESINPQESISMKELKALIANARTPADHERLAAFYRGRAEHFMAQSREHEELAHSYGDRTKSVEDPVYNMDRPAKHCHIIAKDYRDEAKEAIALANIHEQMAKDAGTK